MSYDAFPFVVLKRINLTSYFHSRYRLPLCVLFFFFLFRQPFVFPESPRSDRLNHCYGNSLLHFGSSGVLGHNYLITVMVAEFAGGKICLEPGRQPMKISFASVWLAVPANTTEKPKFFVVVF